MKDKETQRKTGAGEVSARYSVGAARERMSTKETGDLMHKLTPEARAILEAREAMTEEVLTFAEEHPEDMSRLLRNWLKETD